MRAAAHNHQAGRLCVKRVLVLVAVLLSACVVDVQVGTEWSIDAGVSVHSSSSAPGPAPTSDALASSSAPSSGAGSRTMQSASLSSSSSDLSSSSAAAPGSSAEAEPPLCAVPPASPAEDAAACFSTWVFPELQQHSCFACHSGAVAASFSPPVQFLGDGSGPPYEQLKQYVSVSGGVLFNVENAVDSRLFYPRHYNALAPELPPDANDGGILRWIESEARLCRADGGCPQAAPPHP